MKYLYEVWLSTNSKKNKYKASISKDGGTCIALCASSDKEAIYILEKAFLCFDSRPLKNKKKIANFKLKDDCSKYFFTLCIENLEAYVQACQ